MPSEIERAERLGQRGRASVFADCAGDEMALLTEIVVDLRVN
jgi:hypothetical protein